MIKGLTGVDVAGLVGAAMGSTAASPGRHRENGAPAEPVEVVDVETSAPVAESTPEAGDGAPPAAPSAAESAEPAEPSSTATLDRGRQLEDAARWLAGQMRLTAQIERYWEVKLKDLVSRGPRSLAALWRVGDEDVVRAYGEWTVGQFLGKFGGELKP